MRSTLALVTLLSTWLASCDGDRTPIDVSSTAPSSSSPPLWFQDATEALGVDFTHVVSRPGAYFMPDAIGSGVAVLDVDEDSRLDLYLIQNSGDASVRNALYIQDASGRFVDRSEGSGLDVSGLGMGAAVGDLDNDGLPEILLTEYGGARLFWNRGKGRFEEITASAGIDSPGWSSSAAFFDADRDGWLDLVLVSYVVYSASRPCSDASGRPDFCGPSPFPGTVDRLFRNLGGATASSRAHASRSGPPRFEDITVRSGLATAAGPGLGVVCADFDGDHRADIFVANDGKPNHLWIQSPDGTFREEAVLRGLAYNAEGRSQADMGVTIGDVDGDGLFDLYVTHLTEEVHSLFRQGPRGFFRDDAGKLGFATMAARRTGFGAVLGDLDLDGDLDLAQANGRVKFREGPSPTGSPFWAAYAEPPSLFESHNGVFREISVGSPGFGDAPRVARGLALADLDEDGDLDLVLTCTGDRARVFRNVAERRGHWLIVRAVDPARGGRDALGAEIAVITSSRAFQRVVTSSVSYLSSQDSRAHFGLGDASSFERIEVLWPEGDEEVFAGGPVDRRVTLERGKGRAREAGSR